MKVRVTVVEDDIESLEIVKNSLTQYGYIVDSFTDGSESYNYITSNADNINVIILAKTLPNIGGMEILSKIQNNDHLKTIPVIIISVDNAEGCYKDALQMGAQFYVNKPIDSKKILSLVKAAIRSRSRVSENTSFVDKVSRYKGEINS